MIDSTAGLEAILGKTPPAVHLKVIDHIDPSAARWLAASPLMVAAAGDAQGLTISPAGGAPGFATGEPDTLSIPLASIDDPAIARAGAGFGSLFFVPSIGETLRINGKVLGVADDMLRVMVEECYVHCAKSLIRSDFWSASPVDSPPGDVDKLIAACRFIALATIDPVGNADLSPKGDPAGRMARMDGDALWFADRPGNRRADSFRNIIAQPQIAALLIVPGSTQVALVRGRARLTDELEARAAFTVQEKLPTLAICVDDLSIERRNSAALARAALWPAAAAPADIRPAKMFADHVRLNKTKSLGARVASAFVSVPGLMQRGLDKDYKDNLY